MSLPSAVGIKTLNKSKGKSPVRPLQLTVERPKVFTVSDKACRLLGKRMACLASDASEMNVYVDYPQLNTENVQEKKQKTQRAKPSPGTRLRLHRILKKPVPGKEKPAVAKQPKPPKKFKRLVPQKRTENLMSGSVGCNLCEKYPKLANNV